MMRGAIHGLILGALLLCGCPGALPAEEATPAATVESVEQLIEARGTRRPRILHARSSERPKRSMAPARWRLRVSWTSCSEP